MENCPNQEKYKNLRFRKTGNLGKIRIIEKIWNTQKEDKIDIMRKRGNKEQTDMEKVRKFPLA